MKNLKIIMVLLLVTFCIGCSQDDDIQQSNIAGIGFVTTDNGFNFKLTYPDGKVVKETGISVFGVFFNQLLDSDYSIGLSGRNSKIGFGFSYSIPKTLKWKDEINGKHNLRSQRLTLQQTGNLKKMETEFSFDSSGDNDEFDPYVNATGTITTTSDVLVENQKIGIVVEVDVYIVNKKGQRVRVEGLFWKKNASKI